MIPLLVLAAQMAGAQALRPAAQFVASIESCVASVRPDGVDEARLSGLGWIRVTTSAEEQASHVRIYGRPSSIPIYLSLQDARPTGCVVRGDGAPKGGENALVSAVSGEFGPPKRTLGWLREWDRDSHRIVFVPFGFAIEDISKVQK